MFDRPAHAIGGLRYEKTDIDSSALVPIPVSTSWNAANEFNLNFAAESDFTTFNGKYQYLLPNLDVDVRPLDNVVLRASASTTITRSDYGHMQGGQSLDIGFRIGGGTGSQGNPNLKPYKSNNIDLSAEWYYGRDSYASIGYFHKDVSNFISDVKIHTTAFGLTTPWEGPRYDAAVAALGANANNVTIRQYIFDHYPDTTNPTGTDVGGNTTGQIFGTAEDPLLDFEVSTSINNDQVLALYGWEFNIQHAFGDSGFGVIANYTKVDGDAKFDNTKSHDVVQFTLPGMSDSANLVGFYDKNGIQARIAYNWRAQFLTGGTNNPFYTEAYGQFDASASWEFKPGLTAFVEGINLTNESRRVHGRSANNVRYAAPGYARYAFGLRYSF
jgi:TonB-dependent receptor